MNATQIETDLLLVIQMVQELGKIAKRAQWPIKVLVLNAKDSLRRNHTVLLKTMHGLMTARQVEIQEHKLRDRLELNHQLMLSPMVHILELE